MAHEEVEKLKKEINALLRENQQLKAALHIHLPHNGNGNGTAHKAKTDPVLVAMAEQLDQIRAIQRIMSDSLKAISTVGSSIEAILPALDIQLRGYDTTIAQLKEHQEGAENAYASVVKKLENQIREMRQDFTETEQIIHQNHQKQLTELQEKIASMEGELDKTRAELSAVKEKTTSEGGLSGQDNSNPFSSLSIFGI
ncbi:MAG: hypothetical protein R3C61_17710 [Bacteroidia bacterium]